MEENSKRIDELLARLEILSAKHDGFSQEIAQLRAEIHGLRAAAPVPHSSKPEVPVQPIFPRPAAPPLAAPRPAPQAAPAPPVSQQQASATRPPANAPARAKTDFEKFIGENLINKIGIAIIVIGVAIGAKYSIDKNLITPLARILMGYGVGIVLLLLGMKLKQKARYHDFSAVLVSGAMASMYFVTYMAYSLYGLFPQAVTFVLMVVFTCFTVFAALMYNRQVIAHIGLVGAYAVPFMLSEGSGKVGVLFTYMAIINAGILVLSFKRYWKSLYYSACGLTWLIFFSWYAGRYDSNLHFGLAFNFLLIFFFTFYVTFFAYKLIKKEKFAIGDVFLLLGNSFVFFALGYSMLHEDSIGIEMLGLFTLGNAVVHFIASALIYREKLADKNMFFLASGLVLLFITIAVPVQLEGDWVTMVWSGQAALLFWIGRSKQVPLYEKLAYPLMILATISLFHDWSGAYGHYIAEDQQTRLRPFLNLHFFNSMFYVASFVCINIVRRNVAVKEGSSLNTGFFKAISYIAPALLFVMLYLSVRVEIANYWIQIFEDLQLAVSKIDTLYIDTYILLLFKKAWIINFSLLYVSGLVYLNLKKIRSSAFGYILLGFGLVALMAFLTQGLLAHSDLREAYLLKTDGKYIAYNVFYIGIRYLSYIFAGSMLVMIFKSSRNDLFKQSFKIPADLLVNLALVWIASSELLNLMEIFAYKDSYKLALSILWGVYSLALIVFGLWRRKKHLRIGAMSLFGVTLLKLFFYDVSHLQTISKAILFLSLGALLLIISFLYTKYKHKLFDESGK